MHKREHACPAKLSNSNLQQREKEGNMLLCHAFSHLKQHNAYRIKHARDSKLFRPYAPVACLVTGNCLPWSGCIGCSCHVHAAGHITSHPPWTQRCKSAY
eukprot:scaffold171270_cov21-Tisochrysis_lutea.AAC.1